MDHLREENIRYSEIYLKHKVFLKRLFLFAFFFGDMVLILYLAFSFVTYNSAYIQHQQLENNLATTYIPFKELRQRMSPISLKVENVTMVNTEPGKYDLVVKISNPNEKWMVEAVSMVATVDGVVTEPYEVYVLPGSEQYAFWFGLESQAARPAARIKILDTNWKRIRDLEPLAILNEISFSAPRFKNLESGFIVESELKNDTSHGFWHMGVIVVAMRQGEVVGANVTFLEKVEAGSSRSFNVAWPTPISTPQEVKFIPLINIFDEEVYMPPTWSEQSGDPSGVEY